MFVIRILLVLFAVAASWQADLNCQYAIGPMPKQSYICRGRIMTTPSDYTIDRVIGSHLDGMGNDDVESVFFSQTNIAAMPKNINSWFSNLKVLAFNNLPDLPNFQRSDFSEFTEIVEFFASDLPSVTRIPRDAFWDLTELEEITFLRMENLESLDADLLIKARNLREFTALGPNKITQINPGFFRNQLNSLEVVRFAGSNLVRIGYTVFADLQVIRSAAFGNAGCLDSNYDDNVAEALTRDIRANCQDVRPYNKIQKKKVSSSSESGE